MTKEITKKDWHRILTLIGKKGKDGKKMTRQESDASHDRANKQ